jgi:hypothetical protein
MVNDGLGLVKGSADFVDDCGGRAGGGYSESSSSPWQVNPARASGHTRMHRLLLSVAKTGCAGQQSSTREKLVPEPCLEPKSKAGAGLKRKSVRDKVRDNGFREANTYLRSKPASRTLSRTKIQGRGGAETRIGSGQSSGQWFQGGKHIPSVQTVGQARCG